VNVLGQLLTALTGTCGQCRRPSGFNEDLPSPPPPAFIH